MTSLVRVEANEGWTTIQLDRPEKRNALSHAVVDELVAAFEALAGPRPPGRGDDPGSVPIAVLGGIGPVFCAGGDRAETTTSPVASDRLLAHLTTTPVVVVARVEAPAYGAALSVLAACPVVVASPAARFGLPEARLGTFPVPVAQIDDVVPARLLVDMAVHGRELTAVEAADLGLVTAVVPADRVDDEVARWVDQLRARPVVADQARRWWQLRREPVAARDAAVRALVAAGAGR